MMILCTNFYMNIEPNLILFFYEFILSKFLRKHHLHFKLRVRFPGRDLYEKAEILGFECVGNFE